MWAADILFPEVSSHHTLGLIDIPAALSSEGKEIGASCGAVILGVMMGSRVHGACVLWLLHACVALDILVCAFARKFGNKRMCLLVSVTVLSTDRQLLNRFSCNLLLQNCVTKICRFIAVSVKKELQ
jgi:hypothetical protein